MIHLQLHSFWRIKYEFAKKKKAPDCAFLMSQTSLLYFQSVSHQVGGYRHSIDVGTPSALTPADLPLDECDLCPGRSSNLSIYRQSRQRGNLQTCRLNSYLLSLVAQNGEYTPAHPGLWDRLYLNMNWEKPRQRCWQLWCVLRGMHRCYHSLSYARTVRWKPLPGTVLGLSLLMHRLNTTACWYTHTHTHRGSQIRLRTYSTEDRKYTVGAPGIVASHPRVKSNILPFRLLIQWCLEFTVPIMCHCRANIVKISWVLYLCQQISKNVTGV